MARDSRCTNKSCLHLKVCHNIGWSSASCTVKGCKCRDYAEVSK